MPPPENNSAPVISAANRRELCFCLRIATSPFPKSNVQFIVFFCLCPYVSTVL